MPQHRSGHYLPLFFMKNKKNVWGIAHFNVNAYLCPENNEVFSVFAGITVEQRLKQ